MLSEHRVDVYPAEIGRLTEDDNAFPVVGGLAMRLSLVQPIRIIIDHRLACLCGCVTTACERVRVPRSSWVRGAGGAVLGLGYLPFVRRPFGQRWFGEHW